MMRRGRRSSLLRNERVWTFRKLAKEAFADLLKKHKQPVGLKAALKESVDERVNRRSKK